MDFQNQSKRPLYFQTGNLKIQDRNQKSLTPPPRSNALVTGKQDTEQDQKFRFGYGYGNGKRELSQNKKQVQDIDLNQEIGNGFIKTKPKQTMDLVATVGNGVKKSSKSKPQVVGKGSWWDALKEGACKLGNIAYENAPAIAKFAAQNIPVVKDMDIVKGLVGTGARGQPKKYSLKPLNKILAQTNLLEKFKNKKKTNQQDSNKKPVGQGLNLFKKQGVDIGNPKTNLNDEGLVEFKAQIGFVKDQSEMLFFNVSIPQNEEIDYPQILLQTNLIQDTFTLNPYSLNSTREILKALQVRNRIWNEERKPSKEGSTKQQTETIEQWIEDYTQNNQLVCFTLEFYDKKKVFAFIKNGSNQCILSYVQDKEILEKMGYFCAGCVFILGENNSLMVTNYRPMTGSNTQPPTREAILYMINPTEVYYCPKEQQFLGCPDQIGFGAYECSIEIRNKPEGLQDGEQDDSYSSYESSVVHCNLTDDMKLQGDPVTVFISKLSVLDKIKALIMNDQNDKFSWDSIFKSYTQTWSKKFASFQSGPESYISPDDPDYRRSVILGQIDQLQEQFEDIEQCSTENKCVQTDKVELIYRVLLILTKIQEYQTIVSYESPELSAEILNKQYNSFQETLYKNS